jgi:hypothetical protein
MLRAGFSHRQSTLYIAMAHILIIVLAFLLDNAGILFLSTILLVICIALTGIIYFLIYKNNYSNKIPVRKEDAGMINLFIMAGKYSIMKKTPSPILKQNRAMQIHAKSPHPTYYHQSIKTLSVPSVKSSVPQKIPLK